MRRFCALLTALLMAGCPAKKPAAPSPSPTPTTLPEASATPEAKDVRIEPSPIPPEPVATPETSAPLAAELASGTIRPVLSGSLKGEDPRFISTKFEIVQSKEILTPAIEASPTPAPSSTPGAFPSPEPSPAAATSQPIVSTDNGPVEGTWAVTDEQGDVFDIILFPNGQAVSDWTKGPDKARGQHGKWRKQGAGAVINYGNTDSDVIEKAGSGFQLKRLSSRTTVNPNAAKPLAMKRVEAPLAKYVGVWKMNQEPDGSYLMIALQSNGRAMSTVNGGTEGKWEAKSKGALCTWPDGWFDMIERNGKLWQRRSWVGAETNGDADTSEAERVGEGAAAGP